MVVTVDFAKFNLALIYRCYPPGVRLWLQLAFLTRVDSDSAYWWGRTIPLTMKARHIRAFGPDSPILGTSFLDERAIEAFTRDGSDRQNKHVATGIITKEPAMKKIEENLQSLSHHHPWAKKDKNAREKSLRAIKKKANTTQAELADSREQKPYKITGAMRAHRAGRSIQIWREGVEWGLRVNAERRDGSRQDSSRAVKIRMIPADVMGNRDGHISLRQVRPGNVRKTISWSKRKSVVVNIVQRLPELLIFPWCRNLQYYFFGFFANFKSDSSLAASDYCGGGEASDQTPSANR